MSLAGHAHRLGAAHACLLRTTPHLMMPRVVAPLGASSCSAPPGAHFERPQLCLTQQCVRTAPAGAVDLDTQTSSPADERCNETAVRKLHGHRGERALARLRGSIRYETHSGLMRPTSSGPQVLFVFRISNADRTTATIGRMTLSRVKQVQPQIAHGPLLVRIQVAVAMQEVVLHHAPAPCHPP